MKTVIKFLSAAGMMLAAAPVFGHMEGAEFGMWNGYTNIASGFTVVLIWIVLLLLIGVLWKNLHH